MTRWGIIGPGRIARKFADDLRLVPDATLHAVASTDLHRAQSFAHDYRAPYAYGCYNDLLTCPDLDIVYVATPHALHAAHTRLCLENGIAVLCEKPFTVHLSDTQSLIELARTRGVFLMEALWTRFLPAFEQAMALVEAGAIGEVHTVQADFGFFTDYNPAARTYNKALGGGSLLDVGIYPALLAQTVFGKPQKVWATGQIAPTGVDADCVAVLQYAEGKKAILQSNFNAHTPMEAYLYGTKGHLHLHPRWHVAQQLTLVQYTASGNKEEVMLLPFEGWGYHYEAAHAGACLKAGVTESDRVPLHFTLELAETLDAIRAVLGIEYL